ncbi:DNA-directed RNA polymerase subunit omega [Salinicoccus sp. ID82-1]|uniref:DNA-directed RNA polymerase subunit omega n=1 Tax=Salinicoccus cyprini TaxID=2493691 RepID=A0A558AY15_9STAP|nr:MULTISPECIES: DNA-directed RNA polymerase subunit omega [Salinicoccus]MCG1008670.1 DNA-directed RNA polymerase subunit omega [Salinicoccus sp. ID82-1]TVT29147.1 DNA-directed RNA polymerase subunit omega [Salinicoccus cyprini]
MLYPAIHELKKNVDSKYLMVTMAAKRARQLQDHPEDLAMDDYETLKTVSRALEEIALNKVKEKH